MSPRKAKSLSEAFLQALDIARSKYGKDDEERVLHLAFMFTFLNRGRMTEVYQWASLSRLLLVDENARTRIADNLLGMWACAARPSHIRVQPDYIGRTYEELMEIGGNTKLLTESLSYAIFRSVAGLKSVQGQSQLVLNAARAYFVCLRRARELARNSSSRHFDLMGSAQLVLKYFDPMTASDSGDTPVELLKLSKEAVLYLRDFIDAEAGGNGPSVVGISGSDRLLDHHFVAVVAELLLDTPDLSPAYASWVGLARPSIIKILLWIWKNMPEDSMSGQDRDRIFLSSCRLWAPMEKHVEFSRTGKVRRYDDGKPLTPDDLKRITEFIVYIREGRRNSAFISRNADVGINRLYLPFEQAVDWEYKLFDFCEPRRLCCRSLYLQCELL
ncbi:hypothetical protein FS837_009300 [Tulasnella sp. UAMH 9824]|nr:hypothetical protein FS837_009300 [Tulasnella sp. UAMH 9824]